MRKERLHTVIALARKIADKVYSSKKYKGLQAQAAAGILRINREGARPLGKFERWATAEEAQVLRLKGNSAILMNDFMRISIAEFRWLTEHHPQLLKYCRTRRYPDNQWFDSKEPEAQRAQIKALWMGARLYEQDDLIQALEAEVREEEQDDSLEEDSSEQIPCEVASAKKELEDTLEEIERLREGAVRGEDLWTDTPYPVKESDMLFMVRSSNNDLDDLFGEEPRDDRGPGLLITARRMWRASQQEEAMAESTVYETKIHAHKLPSGDAVREIFGDTDSPQFDNGKLVKGFFVGRSEFFAQRDENHAALFDDEYNLKPQKKAAPAPIKWEEIRK